MDLGLKGKKAIICASSRGLGFACARALAREGADVVINGRDADTLKAAEAEIGKLKAGNVTGVIADLNTEDGRAALLELVSLVLFCWQRCFFSFSIFIIF